MITIVQQIAWATSPENLHDILQGNAQPNLGESPVDMSTHGWVQVGTVDSIIHYLPETTCKKEAIAQCNEAIKKVRADTEVKVAHLEQMIQNLLAIEYTAPVARPAPDFSDFGDDDNIPF